MRNLISLLLLVSFVGSISAEELSATSQLSIEIQSACILDNGSGSSSFGVLDFGSHATIASAIDKASNIGNGSIGFKCSPDLPYSIALDFGRNAGTSSQRLLLNNITGATVPYEIYQDPQYTQPWNVTNPVSGVGTGNQQWLMLYGRIPGNLATPAAGIYSDQIGVTLTF